MLTVEVMGGVNHKVLVQVEERLEGVNLVTLAQMSLHITWPMPQGALQLTRYRPPWTPAANFATRPGRMRLCRVLLSSNHPRRQTLRDSSPRLMTNS